MIVKNVIGNTIADKLLKKLREVAGSVVGLLHEVKALSKTAGGEIMVHQVNQPGLVGDGVNRKKKDGLLVLGDDGQSLRNVRVRTDGTLVVSHDQPVEVVPYLTEVHGHVTVDNTLTMNPVMVSNMPTEMKVQEGLHVVPEAPAVKVLPFSFSESLEAVVIPGACRVYSLHITVCEPSQIEIPGLCGSIITDRFDFSVFPSSVQLDKLVINCIGYHPFGGFVVYQSIDGVMSGDVKEEEELSIKELMQNADRA